LLVAIAIAIIDNDEYKTKEHIHSRHGSKIPPSSNSIFVTSMICFNKSVQCMPPSLVTAVETPAKYFAGVENQQKWSKKTKIRIAVMANGRCSLLK